MSPWNEVMHKFKHGSLRSGGGGKVTSRKQAIAIMMSEKRKAQSGKSEYKASSRFGKRPSKSTRRFGLR
jgi:hypothetical protein